MDVTKEKIQEIEELVDRIMHENRESNNYTPEEHDMRRQQLIDHELQYEKDRDYQAYMDRTIAMMIGHAEKMWGK